MYKEKLDRLERKERRQLIWGTLIVVCLCVGAFFLVSVPTTTREVTGTIVNFGTTTSDDGARHYIVVKLDHGTTVSAGVYRGAPIRIGRRVTLNESTMYLGWKRYRFREILDTQANSLK